MNTVKITKKNKYELTYSRSYNKKQFKRKLSVLPMKVIRPMIIKNISNNTNDYKQESKLYLSPHNKRYSSVSKKFQLRNYLPKYCCKDKKSIEEIIIKRRSTENIINVEEGNNLFILKRNLSLPKVKANKPLKFQRFNYQETKLSFEI